MNILLEVSKDKEDGGNLVGRYPLDIPAQDWEDSGLSLLVGMKAIRAKCLDCAATESEVRQCVCTTCPLWPLRLGKYPKGFNAARGV